MPRPQRITQTGAGESNVIPLDHRNPDFNVTLAAYINGAAAYTVELTTDDLQDPTYSAASGNWVDCAEIGSATADAMARLASPVTGVRLNVASGDVSLDILHG